MSCVQPGNNSPVFLLEEIQRTQNNKTRVRASDRVAEAVCVLGCWQEAAFTSLCTELARAGLLGQEPKCGHLSQAPGQPVPSSLEFCWETGLFGKKCLVTDKETLCRDPEEGRSQRRPQLSTKAFTVLPRLSVACTLGEGTVLSVLVSAF